MIRAYTPNDLNDVIQLFRRSIREIASQHYSLAQVAAWAPENPDRKAWARRLGSGGVFVDERNQRVVGLIRIDETGCIDLLYVHPEAQRLGVAGGLFHAALSWAVSRGIRRLRSDVSITARPFFESSGFCVVSEQTVERRGITFRNFHMERVIEAGHS